MTVGSENPLEVYISTGGPQWDGKSPDDRTLYYLMNDWLAEFAFHTTLGVGLFVVAAGAVLVIASGTVGYQSVKAALANPADSLRSE